MSQARGDSACTLVEVARVLVQQRGQYGTGEKYVAESSNSIGAEALSVSFRPFCVVWGASCLLHSRQNSDSCYRYWVEGCPHRESKFEPGRKRHSICGIIDDIEIGNDAQDALLFLDADLFGCDLF